MSEPRTLHVSHVVIASENMAQMASFFREVFQVTPHFENSEFVDILLPSGFRVAFFRPTGAASKYFSASGTAQRVGIGITVTDVEATYRRAQQVPGIQSSGPPKEHPWGEKSFLLIDPEGNRWEVTQSPTPTGELVNR